MDFHFALKIQLKPQINCKIRSQKILWESSKCVKKACPVWNLLRKKINLALYLLTLQDLFNIFYILVPVILSILRFANSAFLSMYLPIYFFEWYMGSWFLMLSGLKSANYLFWFNCLFWAVNYFIISDAYFFRNVLYKTDLANFKIFYCKFTKK